MRDFLTGVTDRALIRVVDHGVLRSRRDKVERAAIALRQILLNGSRLRHRRWRVQNTATGEAYDIVPGANDNVASAMPDAPFGRGDFWVLRYRGTEIDDGVTAIVVHRRAYAPLEAAAMVRWLQTHGAEHVVTAREDELFVVRRW